MLYALQTYKRQKKAVSSENLGLGEYGSIVAGYEFSG